MLHTLYTHAKHFIDQNGEDILLAVAKSAVSALLTETARALEIDLTAAARPQQSAPRTEEEILYTLLSDDPQHIDDLHYKSHIPVGKLSALLLTLEMQGKCQQYAGQRFARAA